MTQHEIRTLEDGTRRYSNGTRYKPVPLEQRKYAVRKPPGEGYVRYRGEWLLPLTFLPDDSREVMPETRPDTDAYDHMPSFCQCLVCSRPKEQVERWRRKWRKERGLQP